MHKSILIVSFGLITTVLGASALGQPADWDLKSDRWVATDALDRTLPGYTECGPPRTGKYVGIFYLLWLAEHSPIGPFDITKILAQYPNAIQSWEGPPSGPWGNHFFFHHWGEPELGYYRSVDPYVMRKHMEMLIAADIDLLALEATNLYTYTANYMLLCSILQEMRDAGIKTPKICFFAREQTLETIYDELYAQNLYPDLWFQWKGKPLALVSKAFLTDPEPSQRLQDFFTLRGMWGWSWAPWFGDGQDRWLWADDYPQAWGWSTPGVPEQTSVSIALQETYMSASTAHGRHYHDGSQPPEAEWTGRGDYFAEQWGRALQIDPEFVFIVGWNEWVAQRFISGTDDAGGIVPSGYTFFVDQYTQEFSRDIEPMKGGHTDNYYYQMIEYIRKFKGVRPPEESNSLTTITIDGSFTDWNGVGPEFRDNIGDTTQRNDIGWGSAGPYVNTTGRNDFKLLKVAHDADNIYFFAETKDNLTPYADPNWMLLFIDADANHSTGWEGYDYLVNSAVVDSQLTTLKERTPQNTWSTVSQVSYKTAGNKLEIRIPRSAIGITGASDFALDFHWADNIQQLDDIIEFGINGDSAPLRRFNYRYTADHTAPASATNFTATAYRNQINLSWTNPTDSDFAGSMIRYRTDTYPTSPTDGILVCNKPNSPGSTDSFAHTDLLKLTTHYYSIFPYDRVTNYASPAQDSASLPIPGDLNGDNDVDQEDFGLFQVCLNGVAAQNDPACEPAHLDTDDDVDNNDFSVFEQCFSGANLPAELDCDLQ